MEEKILKIIGKMEGTLLGIGTFNEKVLENIEKNDKINLCYILSNTGQKSNKKFKLFKKGKTKKVNIKKLKKHFKKKSIDNILCDYEVIKKYKRHFVIGSIYINGGKLYIYGNKKELEELKYKYERYTSDIEIIEEKNKSILVVNNNKTKNKIIKDQIYKFLDLLSEGLDFLTDMLAN